MYLYIKVSILTSNNFVNNVQKNTAMVSIVPMYQDDTNTYIHNNEVRNHNH